ncbi:MAG TPA: glycosyl transferase group 1 [Bacteroidales bacterium]|jgi:glycosyltransferase involved in cell wall biosynthesis|nr:glycosyl transferase group 1 [Bacteroidales bacterium]
MWWGKEFFVNLAKKALTKIVILVTSDIIADQRIHRTASTLIKQGFSVTVVGRRLKTTPKIVEKEYNTVLFRLPFNKGPAFYACYNLWVFIYLLFHRYNLIHANDLDTLLAARITSRLLNKSIVYDSHELFTEVPELVDRPRTRNFWYRLEKRLTKGLQHCSTVSNGVSQELKERYGMNCTIIRNLPFRKPYPEKKPRQDEKTIIYQGALNIGRGLKKLIDAMVLLPNYKLIIVGSGPIHKELKQKTETLKITERVILYGKVEHEHLHRITCIAQLGVSIEEDMGLNYRYALPNKIFDYIQAGIPVLASNLPEMAKIVNTYEIGTTIDPDCNSHQLAAAIESMLTDTDAMHAWHQNTERAADELCWETEQDKLLSLIQKALL